MIKTTRNILLCATLLTSANALEKLGKKEINEIENFNLFKKADVKIDKVYDTGSLYYLEVNIKGNKDQVYLTKDKKYLIAGDVIDVNNGTKLTIPVDLSNAKGKEAFVFGTGEKEYTLFTDPECPYCKKFEEYLPQIKDKVKINVFLYPLDFHKNAKNLSLYILSKNTTQEKIDALFKTTKDSKDFINRKIDKSKLEKLEKTLDEQIKIGQNINVQGTPSLFDKSGKKVSWVVMLQEYGIEVK